MEVRCHIKESEFQEKLESILNSLSKLYSLDTDKFLEAWKDMPQLLRMSITSTAANSKHYKNTELEDIADYCYEITDWYRVEYNKKYPNKKSFTLRNPDDLKQFEEFLDRVIKLMELSPGHFVDLLSNCPDAYWDKIDDLRETSYKLKRDSEEYLRCLKKCKDISFCYSEYMDLFIKNEEDNYNDDE